jgi:hypothetical protein
VNSVEGVRRVFFQIYRVLIALIAVACVVQIFLAGRGVFGIHGSASLDDQHSLNAHRDLGEIIAFGAILAFVCALVMWNKRLIVWTFVLALLAEVVQHATAQPKHPWVSGLHPVSGVAILGISAYLAHSAWAEKGKSSSAGAASAG